MSSCLEYQSKRVYNVLSDRIYGQKDAIRAAVALEAARLKGEKRNMLFAGPTGCGKTEIFRTMSEITHNIYIIDASPLSASGWKGEFKTDNIFHEVLNCIWADKDADKDFSSYLNLASLRIHKSIIVLDEIDKALIKPGGDYNEHIKLAGELLSMLEGKQFAISYKNDIKLMIDTSKISFVLLGAFQGLYDTKKHAGKKIGFADADGQDEGDTRDQVTTDDLIRFGILPELIGRLDRVVTLQGMSEEDYVAAMMNKIDTGFDQEVIGEIAKEAYRQGLGLRWVKKELQRREDDRMLKEIGIG